MVALKGTYSSLNARICKIPKFASRRKNRGVIRLTDFRRELFNLNSLRWRRCCARQAVDVNSMILTSAGLTRVCKSRRRTLHFRVNILSFTRDEYKSQDSRPSFWQKYDHLIQL